MPVKSLPDYASFYTNNVRPLRDGSFDPIVGNKPVRPSVISLCFSCCPIAVARVIAFIVIKPLNGVFFCWSITKIIHKRLKGIFPSITNINAPATIVRVGMAIFIKASSFYARPNVLFWNSSHAMRCYHFIKSFFVEAPTRFGCSVFKFGWFDDRLIATITNTLPFNWISGVDRNNSKTIEFLTSKVYELIAHNILRLNIDRMKSVWRVNTVFTFQSLNLATEVV